METKKAAKVTAWPGDPRVLQLIQASWVRWVFYLRLQENSEEGAKAIAASESREFLEVEVDGEVGIFPARVRQLTRDGGAMTVCIEIFGAGEGPDGQ